MRTKKFIKNTIFAGLNYLVIFITGLFLPKLYVTFAGDAANGLLSSLTAFISYFVLIEAGFRTAAQFTLYKPVANDDKEKRDQVLSNIGSTLRKISYFFMLFVIVFGIFAAFTLKVDGVDELSIFFLTIILSLPTFFNFFFSYKYTVLLTVHQRSYVTQIGSMIERAISFALIYILLKFVPLDIGPRLIVVKSALVLVTLCYVLFLVFFIKKEYPDAKYNVPYPKKLIPNQKYAFLNSIISKIDTALAPIVATLIFSDNLAMVSVLAVHGAIIFGISGILNIFRTGVSAGFGEIIAREETYTLRKAYSEFQAMFYFVATLVNILIISLLPSFMNLYMPVKDDISYVMLAFAFLFTIATFFSDLNVPQEMILNAAGKYRERRIVNIVSIVVAPILTITLGFIGNIWGLGLEGIMVGLLLYSIMRFVWLVVLVSKHALPQTHKRTLFLVLSNIAMVLLLGIPNYVFYDKISLMISNYLYWILYAVIVGVAALAVMMSFYLIFDRSTIKQLLNRFKKMKKPKSENNSKV